MTPAIGRLFLFLDEWIGIFLLLYLWKTGETLLFAVFLPLWAIAVYVIGYRRQWDHEERQEPIDAYDRGRGTK